MYSILIIEDERLYIDILTDLLSECYQIEVARSGKEAQEKLKNRTPDLILLDVLMPGMDGFEICRWLKENPALNEIPVIFLTVKSSVEDEIKGFSLGAVDYIAKPLSPPIVKERIKTHLALSDARKLQKERANSLDKIISQRTKELLVEIEERKSIELALRRQEKELRQILENVLAGILVTDEQGRILSFNPAAEKIFGYAQNEIIGRNICEILSPDSTENYIHDIVRLASSRPPNLEVNSGKEMMGIHNNGDTFPIQIHTAELPSNKEKKRRFISSFFNLSAQKQQERQLFQLNKMESLSTLTSGIVHDYNNMLGVILGYSELLQAQLIGNPTLYKYAETIVKSAERGSALSKKLLSISKHDTSQEKRHDINHLIREIKLILEKMVGIGINIDYQLCSAQCNVKVDAGDFNDAVLNICSNAKFAMPRGGKLSITTEIVRPDKNDQHILQLNNCDHVKLAITDTGAGMDEQVLAKIYDPFYTTKGESGTGLGMTQVYSFIKRSHGMITVDSKPDQGASFSLYFPLISSNALNPEPA